MIASCDAESTLQRRHLKIFGPGSDSTKSSPITTSRLCAITTDFGSTCGWGVEGGNSVGIVGFPVFFCLLRKHQVEKAMSGSHGIGEVATSCNHQSMSPVSVLDYPLFDGEYIININSLNSVAQGRAANALQFISMQYESIHEPSTTFTIENLNPNPVYDSYISTIHEQSCH
ncbi:hypothetical protein Cni_G29183 [Canna indica]|uniref:Uncharacterized protein n=1 Tax=Canna indica TaxID=4628 RepID=A0AAQ3L7V1_9LILI|nr:hypothetical protein Cni_G29183 [Canna indica]